MSFKSDFLNESKERGFIHQCTDLDGLDAALSGGALTAYTGFDPTGPSLHVGHLMPIMWLRLLQKCGHNPIVLMGGATSLIGDPTGKDTQRPLLTVETVNQNIKSLGKVFSRYIDFGDSKATVVNNNDWLSKLNYIEFLRDFGTHFSVNRMLTLDSVRTRLEREQPLNLLEFNYMIMQAFDFMHLNQTSNCLLQMAGSDQWGNIINGVELTRRIHGKTVYGLTAPLLTTSSGAKMGKTEGGAVWLNSDMLSPYDFWQYWRNTNDADVGRFLRIFTELPISEIQKLEVLKDAELNEAKKILADEATILAHGFDHLAAIHEQTKQLFEAARGDISSLTAEVIALADLPIGIDELFVRFGLTASKGEAKRLIQGGAVRVNDCAINDVKAVLGASDFNEIGRVKISSGKKKHLVLEMVV
ncbi:MAG: tyrosine--tRNA ligase [Candidatus Paracaedibacteraceae bacterium]|nr:tyrosine--tRNA ligase [Candidatus Paracaedibacteraceae bacterium]